MFDNITQSADGLFILLGIMSLVAFFFAGPHKIYEAVFGSLVGIGCYIFVREMTFVFPEFTRSFFLGNWLVDNRGSILLVLKFATILLFFFTPLTLAINVSGLVRGNFWFIMKTLILGLFYVTY